MFKRLWARFFGLVRKPVRMLPLVGIIILVVAFWTSKHFISQPPVLPSKWCRLLTPTAIFLLSSFVTAFLGFLMVMVFTVILSLLRPGHISEFGAKILGIELSYKRDALNGEKTLSETGAQLDSVTDLIEKTLEYLAGPFEPPILKEADQADAIRSVVRDVLVNAYYKRPKVQIHVVPLTDDGLVSLGERLAAVVRREINGIEVTTTVHRTVGLGIHYGTEGLNTAIVIDTAQEGRAISTAEICAASVLFVAVSTAISWAQTDNAT